MFKLTKYKSEHSHELGDEVEWHEGMKCVRSYRQRGVTDQEMSKFFMDKIKSLQGQDE
jgi:hypothetical protein